MNLKEKALSGQKIFGTMIRIQRSPAIAYAAKNSGLDFVMYDCEHSSYTMERPSTPIPATSRVAHTGSPENN